MNRIWKICTKDEDRNEEIEILRKILSKNEYPVDIVDKEIAIYLNQKS